MKMAERMRNEARVRRLVELVCKELGTDPNLVLSRHRRDGIPDVRHLCMFLAIEELGLSFNQLEKVFDRDHTTIMHAWEKVSLAVKQWPEMRDLVVFLRRRVREELG